MSGGLAPHKGQGVVDLHGAFTQKLFEYFSVSKNTRLHHAAPREAGLCSWPCFTEGGSRAQRR